MPLVLIVLMCLSCCFGRSENGDVEVAPRPANQVNNTQAVDNNIQGIDGDIQGIDGDVVDIVQNN